MYTEEEVIDMLPADLRRIAEVAGLKAAVKIGRAFRGAIIYVPGVDALQRAARDSAIKKDYSSGSSARALARKHGITERRIRKILASTEGNSLPEDIITLLSDELN